MLSFVVYVPTQKTQASNSRLNRPMLSRMRHSCSTFKRIRLE